MTKKQIANSKRRTLKRAKKSIRRRAPKQIQKLNREIAAARRALNRKLDVEFARQEKIILQAFKRVPAKDREVELPGYDIPPGESGLRVDENGNLIYPEKKGKRRKGRRKVNPRK